MSYTQVPTRNPLSDTNSAADVNQLQANIEALKGGTGATAPTTTIEALSTSKQDAATAATLAATIDDGDIAVGSGGARGLAGSALSISELKDLIDPLGIPKGWMGTSAPTNHVLAMNKTIGDNTGDYQGTDYLALYTALWNTAGTANTTGHWMTNGAAKGASAAVDWAAHRTITMDYRGAVLRAIGAGVGWTETTESNATVNSKQDDYFQGHIHDVKSIGGLPTQTGLASFSIGKDLGAGALSTSATVHDVISTPYTDGTNGTPRTAKETRMKNIGVNIIFRYK